MGEGSHRCEINGTKYSDTTSSRLNLEDYDKENSKGFREETFNSGWYDDHRQDKGRFAYSRLHL